MDIFLNRYATWSEIVLNRPSKLNALTVDMWRQIPILATEAAKDTSLRVLVIKGSGSAFSSGADIAEFPTLYASRESAIENQKTIQDAMSAIENYPCPTLAVIEGPCYGGGCGLALSCDMRISADTAKFAITPAKLGLVYGVDDTRRLVAAVGLSRAKDILFTGRRLDASEALRIGLVEAVHPVVELTAAINSFVRSLENASSHSARGTKIILQKMASGTLHDDENSRALFGDAFSSQDFKEGFAAFTQKRPTKFT